MDKYTLLSSPSIALKMRVLYQNLNNFLSLFTFYEEKRLETDEKNFLAMLGQFEKGLRYLASTSYFSKEEIEAYVIFLAKIYENLDFELSSIYKIMMCLFIDMGEKEKAYAAYEKWYHQSFMENDGKISGASKFLDRQYLARFFAYIGERDRALYYLGSMSSILKHVRKNPIEIMPYLSLANYLGELRLKLALIRQSPINQLTKRSTLMQFWYGVSFKPYTYRYTKQLNDIAQALDRRNQNTYYQAYLVKGIS